jgi:fibronectin-binding autotransporter adhesin
MIRTRTRQALRAVAAVVWSSFLTEFAVAANDIWSTATGDFFHTDSRWDDSSPPSVLDSATFDKAGTYNVSFNETTFATYGGEPTINDLFVLAGNVTFATTSGPTRTLSMNGVNGGHSIDVQSATVNVQTLNMQAENLLWVTDAGTLNINSGATLDIGLLGVITSGGTLNISNGGDLDVTGGIDLAGLGNGTITVTGAGSTISSGGSSLWGGGGTATATFSTSATGTFSDGIELVSNAAPGNSALVNVQTGADLFVSTELNLAQFGGAGNTATLNITGSGSTVTVTGAGTMTIGHASTGSAAINIGTTTAGGLLTTGTGTATIKKTGTVTLGSATNTGSLFVNGALTIDGGALLRNALGTITLAPGAVINIENGGRFTNNSNYNTSNHVYNVSGMNSKFETTSFIQLGNGATINVSAGGLLSATQYIDIGIAGNGTLNATGTGTQIQGGSGASSYWGENGHTAILSFTSNALANFSNGVEMARSSTAGTSATADVLSGADLTIGSFRMATSGGTTTSATLNVQGSGSTVVTGSISTVIGHAATGTATINIGTTTAGASFTTNSITTTINKTGTVNIGSGSTNGTFTVNGNLTINGGVLTRAQFSSFNILGTSRNIRVENGGRATFTGSYNTANAAYTITGLNSRMETTANMEIRSGATVTVSNGGTLSSGSFLDIGISTAGTLNAFGAGANVTAAGTMWWGSDGGAATVDFSNDATGVFSTILMARGTVAGTSSTVSVLSGADVTVGLLAIAVDGGPTGTLNVQGAGSTVTQLGANNLTIGHATNGTATVNIGTASSGAVFSTAAGSVSIRRRGTVNVGSAFGTGTFHINGNASVNGLINVNAGSTVNIAAGKTLTLNSTGLLTTDGRLKGVGTVNGTVHNGGVVEVGQTIGSLNINGNYISQNSGTLWMELNSTMNHDKLLVSGHATLAGQILIQLAGGFAPAAGDSFDLIDWGTVSGDFTVWQYPGLADGLEWDFTDLPITGKVHVVSTTLPTLPGDFNEDGAVDTADYVMWRKTDGAPATYDDWVNHFGEAPGSGSSTDDSHSNGSVPEPSLAMMIAAIVCASRLRRRT